MFRSHGIKNGACTLFEQAKVESVSHYYFYCTIILVIFPDNTRSTKVKELKVGGPLFPMKWSKGKFFPH